MGFEERLGAAILGRIRRRKAALPVGNASLGNGAAPAPARLRVATFSDFEGITALKSRCGLFADSMENWNRLWRSNPALQGVTDRPIGWVLEADQKVVGYLGNISLRCRYGNRILSAVTSHGFAVDPPYRAVALSLASAFYRQKSVDAFISSSAIEATGKMSLAFKCAALPQPDYSTVLFWVLRTKSFSRVLMTRMDIRPAVAPIASNFIAIGIAVDKVLRRRGSNRALSALTVTEGGIDSIGVDIDDLLADILNDGQRLYADRSAQVLRWHFEIPGDRGTVRVFRSYENQKLRGYAVVRTDIDDSGLKKSVLADLIARNDDPEIVRALWVAIYEHASAIGSDVLEVQGFPSSIRQVLLAFRPYRRKLPACPYFYRATDSTLHQTLGNALAWYACPFDGDATLIRPSYSSSGAPTGSGHLDHAHNSGDIEFAKAEGIEAV